MSLHDIRTPEWFDHTAQSVHDALGDNDAAKASVNQLVGEIRVLRQSTADLLVMAWQRGTKAARDYRGDVVEPCPFGPEDAEPLLFTAEQMRAAREESWDAGRDQGTKYGWTFDDFADPPHTEEERTEAYGVNPWKIQTLKDKHASRLTMLWELEDGWYGPHSLAPATDVMANLEALLSQVTVGPEALGISARTDGGVSLEWHAHAIEHTIVLDPDGTAHVFADHVATDEITELEGDFDAPYLAAQLQAAGEAHAAESDKTPAL
jgi:hypothetical protein